MLENLRTEFLISVVARDPVVRIKMKQTLTKAGYEVLDFESGEDALVEVRARPPHIVCYYVEEDGMSIRNWMDTIKAFSSEIMTVAVASPLDLSASKLLEQGAQDLIWVLNLDFPDLVSRIDRIGQSILEKFEIHDLREQIGNVEQKANADARGLVSEWEQKRPLDTSAFLNDLRKCGDVNAIMKELGRHVATEFSEQIPVFVFRYLPVYQSLLALGNFGVTSELPEGTGIDWRRLNSVDRARFRKAPESDPNVQRLLHVLAGDRLWTWQPLSVGDQFFDGFVAIGTDMMGELTALQIQARIEIAQLAAELFDARFRLHREQLRESVSGVWKRHFFEQRLTEETRRSYRLKSPLSILRLQIQNWAETVELVGEEQANAVLKYLGQLMNQSSRTTDVVGYWGDGEFIIALPHTDKEGCRIRQQRLSVALKKSNFPMLSEDVSSGLRFRFGQSCYPSQSLDIESLLSDSAQRLDDSHGFHQAQA